MNQRITLRAWTTFIVVSTFIAFLSPSGASAKETAVLILPVKAPAFESIEAGIRDVLADKIDLRVFLASDYRGGPGGVIQAAVAEKPTCILSVGTTLSRAFIAAMESQSLPPVIGVAVTNPADVLLEAQISSPRSVRATIVTDGPPSIYSETASLIATLYPNTKRLGTVYNPGEANSLFNRQRIAEQAEQHQWNLVEKAINEPGDVEAVARALLAERVDAVWISKDRIMTSQPGRLIELAHGAGVPVFASDAGTVRSFDALGTRSVSFEQLGRHVGELVLQVAAGKDVRQMPISTVEQTTTFLSRPAIKVLGVRIPPEVAAGAQFYDENDTTPPVPTESARGWIIGISVGATVTALLVVIWVVRRRHARDRR